MQNESQIFLSALASAFEEHNPIKLDVLGGKIDATYIPEVSIVDLILVFCKAVYYENHKKNYWRK